MLDQTVEDMQNDLAKPRARLRPRQGMRQQDKVAHEKGIWNSDAWGCVLRSRAVPGHYGLTPGSSIPLSLCMPQVLASAAKQLENKFKPAPAKAPGMVRTRTPVRHAPGTPRLRAVQAVLAGLAGLSRASRAGWSRALRTCQNWQDWGGLIGVQVVLVRTHRYARGTGEDTSVMHVVLGRSTSVCAWYWCQELIGMHVVLVRTHRSARGTPDSGAGWLEVQCLHH